MRNWWPFKRKDTTQDDLREAARLVKVRDSQLALLSAATSTAVGGSGIGENRCNSVPDSNDPDGGLHPDADVQMVPRLFKPWWKRKRSKEA